MKSKSPYLDFTEEEIEQAEAGAYVIQLGVEFFEYKGRYTFTLGTAEKFYDDLRERLTEMVKSKSAKPEDLTCLLNLRILPFRFH